MPSKEIKVEVVELMKIIVKQLENLMRQREEDQVFLAGLEQRLTALEQRLPAQPLAPVSADATATHDATSMSLTNSTSGALFSSGGIAAAVGTLAAGQIGHLHHFAPPSYSSNPRPNPFPILPPTYQQLVQLTPLTNGLQLEAVEVEKLQGGAEVVPPPPAAGSELIKKYHVLLHPRREQVVFSTSQNTGSWRYTSLMWGYLGHRLSSSRTSCLSRGR
jgi:hypothetical protein